ncbi:hypothetical protein O3M35_009185 [Rhynocoris fuscipes]|uniref:Phospholipid scramblase n=1 Tax=Rhynocoris fuscipes TaxID=488301 RepID=A0AAW1D9K6_9HEMI
MSDSKSLASVLREAESENEFITTTYLNESNQELTSSNNAKIVSFMQPSGSVPYKGPTVYSNEAVITKQPSSLVSDTRGNRCPLPISVVSHDYQQLNNYVIPYSGVQLFNDVDQINIEQTVEIDDLSSFIESENRFLIKGDRGQVLFSGLERSSAWQRLLCGSGRKFLFRIFDRSKQEALFFTRRLACSTPPFGVYLQRLDVFIPLCEYIGSVQQLWTPMVSSFSVRNANHCEIFRVEGPIFCGCFKQKEAKFNVFRAGNLSSVTTITHEWDERLVNYNMTVNFPPRICYNYKALLTACAILLEYMYFEISQSGRCIHCFN